MHEKLLIIQTAFIGDAILTLPMIQHLHDKYPSAQIDVISIPSTGDIFRSSDCVDNVHILSKHSKHKSIISTIKFALSLKKIGYDKIISPHRSFRTALIVFFASAKESIGFENSAFKFVFNKRVEYCSDCHEVERNLKLVAADIENGAWKLLPIFRLTTGGIDEINNIFAQNSKTKFMAVAPGSVWKTKRYPKEYFIEIIKRLAAKGIRTILIGGKEDIELCGEILSASNSDAISYAGKFTIPETVEMLRKCALLVSNDSGPTHMAMAADIPAITIYCSTVPEFGFYPYNKKSAVLSYSDLDCKPCGIHGHESCPIGTFDCGNKLLPSKVIDSIENLIEQ